MRTIKKSMKGNYEMSVLSKNISTAKTSYVDELHKLVTKIRTCMCTYKM